MARIEARHAVLDVLQRYARGVDRRDWDLVRSCYHPGATDDHGVYQGDVEGFVSHFAQAAERFAGTYHLVGGSTLDMDLARGVVLAETYCVAHHWFAPSDPPGHDLVMAARYLDRFELRSADASVGHDAVRWKIVERTVVVDWTSELPASSAPWPLAARFASGLPGPSDPSYAHFASGPGQP